MFIILTCHIIPCIIQHYSSIYLVRLIICDIMCAYVYVGMCTGVYITICMCSLVMTPCSYGFPVMSLYYIAVD